MLTAAIIVSTQKHFIKLIFHCALRLLEGQLLKAKDRNLLDRELQGPNILSITLRQVLIGSVFHLSYYARLALLVSQATTLFYMVKTD